jgi:hypothetical protein
MGTPGMVVSSVDLEFTKHCLTPLAMHAVKKDGKCFMEIRVGDARALCESMTLLLPGKQGVKLSTMGDQVCIAGPCFKAMARSITGPSPDGQLIMRGDVRVSYHKQSQASPCCCDILGNVQVVSFRQQQRNTELTADQVKVNLVTGRIEIDP